MHDQKQILNQMLSDTALPRLDKTIVWVVVVMITSVILMLYLIPWTQTALGMGTVTTLNPGDRAQPISALVQGQIKTWHVREGDKVSTGDPIVTLVDTDDGRVEKLTAQFEATRERHNANLQAVMNAEKDLNRQKSLLNEGLTSPREVEVAEIRFQDLRAKASKTEEDINKVNMALSRQSIETKVAPRDGTITRLASGGLSTYVKPGDPMAWFIPDGIERAVAVKVGGLDAALITPQRKARLQFEGWPMLQVSGWPNTSIGTFAGEVVYVDPMADPHGQFTVWIKADESGDPWPSENSVRLGSRVKAWILMEEVSLGYEIWRQLNNFPPESSQSRPWGAG